MASVGRARATSLGMLGRTVQALVLDDTFTFDVESLAYVGVLEARLREEQLREEGLRAKRALTHNPPRDLDDYFVRVPDETPPLAFVRVSDKTPSLVRPVTAPPRVSVSGPDSSQHVCKKRRAN